MEQLNIFFEFFRSFMLQLGSFLPKILGALVILVVGWIIAKIIKAVFIKALNFFRLNFLAEKAGIEKFLKDGGVKLSSIEIIGALAYWLIMLIVLLAAFNSLGLSVASELFRQIVLYIPNVFVAVAILIIGLFLANFISEILLTYLKNVGVEKADVMSNIGYYAVVIFAVLIALDQLNIGTDIINSAFKYIIGGICLALALAFGLGGREWAAHILDKIWKK
jgi:hypothetical protein